MKTQHNGIDRFIIYQINAACLPDKSPDGSGLKPSGKFTRRKDRDTEMQNAEGKVQNENGGGGYRRAQGPGEAGRTDHGAVKVHVGKYAGIELRDLNPEAVQALAEKWLPTAKANAKPTADDRRLIVALEWWAAEKEKADDNVPY